MHAVPDLIVREDRLVADLECSLRKLTCSMLL